MTDDGEYECNVTITKRKILHLEHADAWPTIGAVTRLVGPVLSDSTGEPVACFPHAITVRATSQAGVRRTILSEP